VDTDAARQLPEPHEVLLQHLGDFRLRAGRALDALLLEQLLDFRSDLREGCTLRARNGKCEAAKILPLR
jgi:hypothetical protein